MSVEFVIFLFIGYSTALFAIFKLIRRSELKDNDKLVDWIGSNAELIRDKTNALNEASKKLEEMYWQTQRETENNNDG